MDTMAIDPSTVPAGQQTPPPRRSLTPPGRRRVACACDPPRPPRGTQIANLGPTVLGQPGQLRLTPFVAFNNPVTVIPRGSGGADGGGLIFSLTSQGGGVAKGIIPLPSGSRHVGRGMHLIEYVGNYVTVEDETVEVYLDGVKASDVTDVKVQPEDGYKDALIFSGRDSTSQSGTLPSKRFGHASDVVGGQIFMFGGAVGSNREPTDELYAIDMGADYALYSTTDYTISPSSFKGAKDDIVKVEVNTIPAYVSYDCSDVRFKSQPDERISTLDRPEADVSGTNDRVREGHIDRVSAHAQPRRARSDGFERGEGVRLRGNLRARSGASASPPALRPRRRRESGVGDVSLHRRRRAPRLRCGGDCFSWWTTTTR